MKMTAHTRVRPVLHTATVAGIALALAAACGTPPAHDSYDTDTAVTATGPTEPEIVLPTPVPLDDLEPGEPPLTEVVFEGDYAIDAGPAGVVVVAVSDGTVTLADEQLAPGWIHESLGEDGGSLELELTRGDDSVEVEVAVSAREFSTDVQIDIAAEPGESSYSLGAGDVTISVDGDRVELANIAVGDDWDVRGEDRGRRRVDLDISHRETRQNVAFRAETDDDRLDVRISTRTRSVRITHE